MESVDSFLRKLMSNHTGIIKKNSEHDPLLGLWAEGRLRTGILGADPRGCALFPDRIVRVNPTFIACDHVLQQQRFIHQFLQVVSAYLDTAHALFIGEQFGDEAGGDFLQFEVFPDNLVH